MNEALFYIIVGGFLLFIISGISKEMKKDLQPTHPKHQVIVVSDERYYKATEIIELLNQYPDNHTKTLVLMELLPKVNPIQQSAFNEQSLTKSLDFVERVAGIVNKKPERKIERWQLL